MNLKRSKNITVRFDKLATCFGRPKSYRNKGNNAVAVLVRDIGPYNVLYR